MQRDFPEYTWSLRTLDRRLRFLDINKTDNSVPLEEVQRVVLGEISSPGSFFGCSGIHAQIRQYCQF